MELEKELKKALEELRQSKERKFDQTVDLILNLKKFDVKKSNVNLLIEIPHKIKDKKIAAFFETKNNNVDTITFAEFKKYKDKHLVKKLVDKYDFFIAQASLMPKVATFFGRVLGPTGKMPSPQLGILATVDDESIATLKNKINNTVKFKVKEASIKLPVGKQSMKDSEIIENIIAIYDYVVPTLPRNIENIKNVELKFTMTKPVKISIK
ncbi:hypothetical protein ISS08_00760 [Candidatus Pacearchaeota archaeon]|nr:hypothetical protein [Candidatus Pacearchaeota archaeon]